MHEQFQPFIDYEKIIRLQANNQSISFVKKNDKKKYVVQSHNNKSKILKVLKK